MCKGRRNKLPNTSDQETENYVTNDHETTEAIVTIEDELDADLYTDPGENDKKPWHIQPHRIGGRRKEWERDT